MTGNGVELLAMAGHAAASADNSQPWRIAWDGNCLSVQFREPECGLSPAPMDTATLLAMGGVVENIVQMGTCLGLNLVPETGISPPLDRPTYARIPVGPLPQMGGSPRDHPLFARHTNRFPYQARALPEESKEALQGMSEGSAHIQLVDEEAYIRQIATLIKTASEVRFRVREAHEWLAGSLRFDTANDGDDSGMDVRTLDLPPGGPLLLRLTRSWRVMSILNKLGAYKFMAATDAAAVYAAPALVVIKASSDDSGAIEAGRLLTRAWIRLNEQNIAVHPYYVITDQLARMRENTLPARLRKLVLRVEEESTRCCALAEGESLYMVLRVGFPQKSAPRSNRVALEKVYKEVPAKTPPGE